MPFKYEEIITIDNKRYVFPDTVKPIIKNINKILSWFWSILFISILCFSMFAISKVINIWIQLFIGMCILTVHIIIFVVISKHIINKNLPSDYIVRLELLN